MKALQDTHAAADRISTREELFQVLDLLIGFRKPGYAIPDLIFTSESGLSEDAYAEPADPVSDLNGTQEPVLASDMTSLTELLLGKNDQSN
jgi:hypothetical protein